MTAQLYNNVSDALLNSIDNVQTSFDLVSGNIPPVASGDYIPIHVVRSSDGAFEIMHVTDVDGPTVTVTRSAEDTSPLTFPSGDAVQVRPTRQALAEMEVTDTTVSSSTGVQLLSIALDERISEGDPIKAPSVIETSDDGSRPLKISNFLEKHGGDQDLAMQDAINALHSNSGSFRRVLDLEGRIITLSQTITIPAAQNANQYMINGEIVADGTFPDGDYLFDGTASSPHTWKISNVTFIGTNLANWIKWDGFDIIIDACTFRNNSFNGDPGLWALSSSHLWMYSGDVLVNDASISPSSRQRYGIRCEGADNKIFNLRIAYFRTSLRFDSVTAMIGNVHVFQGEPGGDNTNFTPGIEFTAGQAGSQIVGLYLDKCYIELNNRTAPTSTTIGGLTWTGGKTLINSDDSTFKYVVAADRQSNSANALSVNGVSITGVEFTNFGLATVSPTGLGTNAAAFDRTTFNDIHMSNNTYRGSINKQSNPISVSKSFAGDIQHPFDLTGMLPFGARLRYCTSIAGRPISGSATPLVVGNIDAANNVVRIDSPATSWEGDIAITATTNDIEI